MMAAATTCPYCRSPIGTGQDAEDCPACGTSHHSDCWQENGGCAVVGCSAGPAAAKAAGIALPPIQEPASPVEVEVGREDKSRRVPTSVIVTAAVTLVMGIGVAAAIVLYNSNKESARIDVAEPAVDVAGGGAPVRASGASGAPANGPRDPSEFSDAEVIRGAKQVLQRHHEFLEKAAGNSESEFAKRAYALLSVPKQQKETQDGSEVGESGFEFWIHKNDEENLRIGQEVCLPGSVSLENPEYPGTGSWDPRTGVAMVYVDYGTYRGSTWVHYEHGHWRYEPGYSLNETRRAQWEDSDALFEARGETC